MQSANLFGPLKGLCPHKALIGLTQASGLAGGFDFNYFRKSVKGIAASEAPADGR